MITFAQQDKAELNAVFLVLALILLLFFVVHVLYVHHTQPETTLPQAFAKVLRAIFSLRDESLDLDDFD